MQTPQGTNIAHIAQNTLGHEALAQRETLCAVAKYQRQLLLSIAFSFLTIPFGVGIGVVLGLVKRSPSNQGVALVYFLMLALGLMLFAILVWQVINYIKLTNALQLGAHIIALYFLGWFVPMFSFCLTVYVSHKATQHLRAGGVSVGFLGASPAQLRAL